MQVITQRLGAALLVASLFTACSRPVAYFQPSPREHFAKSTKEVAPTTVTEAPAVETATPVTSVASLPAAPQNDVPAITPAQQVAQVNTAVTQLEAYTRNDSKLAANKKLNKRMERVKQLLAVATAKTATAPAATASPKKMSLIERMMVKRLNKQINGKLAPEQTKRAMASKGVLVLGAILVVVGLILTIWVNVTIGIILLLAGAVILILGLIV